MTLSRFLTQLTPTDRAVLPLSLIGEASELLRGGDASVRRLIEGQVRFSREIEEPVILKGKERTT